MKIFNHDHLVKLKRQREFSSDYDQITSGTCTDVNSTSALRRVSQNASNNVTSAYHNQPTRTTNGFSSASKDQYHNSFRSKPKPYNTK